MNNHLLKLLAGVLVSSSLSGCTVVRWFSTNATPQGATFVQELPPPVSVAWRDGGGDVWVVPKRGILIEQIYNNATPAAWAAQGSYVVVRGRPQKMHLLADKHWWPLVIPEKSP